MKKRIILVLFVSLLCVLLIFFLMNDSKYNEKYIIGKTKEQVVEKYGDFEWYIPQKDENEQMSHYIGVYTVKPKEVGYLGTKPPIYFYIKFNAKEIAVECYEEVGGQGG